MKIALLAPIAWRVPPRHYGPWERVVALLARGLTDLGADVTTFATRDSQPAGRLDGLCPAPYEEDGSVDAGVWSPLHIGYAMERAAQFDVVHNHFDFGPLAWAGVCSVPLVTTVHGFSSERILPAYRFAQQRGAHFVSISDSDRHPDLTYAATVHHGIDLEAFTPRAQPWGEGAGYLLFFGRVHPDKGAADAVNLARATGHRLILAGIVQDAAYWREQVEPHVDGEQVRYVGSVGPAERDRLLGGAAALLHPIHFDEPFGLSVVEAMACGTPVVATRRGSMPEVVTDGLTGILVGGWEEGAERLPEALALDRAAVRAECERRFSRARMAADYLRVYERIVGEA